MKKHILLLLLFLWPKMVFSSDLPEIIKRGYLNCGIYMNDEVMVLDETFIDAELCKVISVGLFSSKKAVEFLLSIGNMQFDVLEQGEIDIFFAVKNKERRDDKRFILPITHMYNKQILVSSGHHKGKTLEDFPKHTKICVTKNTAPEKILRDFLKGYSSHKFEIVLHARGDMSKRAFLREECDLFSGESIVISRMFSNNMEGYEKIYILPDIVKILPITSIVDKGSYLFARYLKTLRNAMLRAESLGITKLNVDEVLLTSKDPEILYMLGKTKGIGLSYNIDDKWFYRIIKEYGNYTEFFEERYGKNTPYSLIDERLNKSIEDGGLFEVHPFVPKQF